MITQFHIFGMVILTVKFMLARSSGRDKPHEWQVYLLAMRTHCYCRLDIRRVARRTCEL